MSETDPVLQTVWESEEDWNPRSHYRTLVARIQNLLQDGNNRTARDCYYALESRGYQYDYDEVARAVRKGRLAGYIHPAQIVDTSRRADWTVTDGEVSVRWDQRTLEYEGPGEFLDTVVGDAHNVYFENFWKEQSTYVEVWLEKASLSSVLKPICREWNVRLEATRGDWSHSKIFRATQRLNQQLQDGKDVRILYFGDFNPSGFHAPVAVQETMGKYGVSCRDEVDSQDSRYFDIWPHDEPEPMGRVQDGEDLGTTIQFERVAMNVEHIDRYDLPENPTPGASDKDRTIRERFMAFVTDGRDVNVELNALKEFHREEFEEMVRDAIRQHVDVGAKEAFEERMEEERERIEDAVRIDRGA